MYWNVIFVLFCLNLTEDITVAYISDNGNGLCASELQPCKSFEEAFSVMDTKCSHILTVKVVAEITLHNNILFNFLDPGMEIRSSSNSLSKIIFPEVIKHAELNNYPLENEYHLTITNIEIIQPPVLFKEDKAKKYGIILSWHSLSMTDCKLSFDNPNNANVETCRFYINGYFSLVRLTIDTTKAHTFSVDMFDGRASQLKMEISDCIFSDMTFMKGSFLCLDGEMLSITNCTFQNITGLGSYAPIIMNIESENDIEKSFILNNSTLENCKALNSKKGGAMKILLDKRSTLTAKGSQTLFKSCGCDATKTGKGGGIYIAGDLDVELMFEKEIRFEDNEAAVGKNMFLYCLQLEAVVQRDHFMFAADANGEFTWKENELIGLARSGEIEKNLNLFMFLCKIKRTSVYISQNGSDTFYCGETIYPCESVEFSVSQFEIKNTDTKTLYFPELSTISLKKAIKLEKELSSVAFSVAGASTQTNDEQMAKLKIESSVEALSDECHGCVNCYCTSSFSLVQFELPEKFTSPGILPSSVISWNFDEHSATLFLDKCIICATENVFKPLKYKFLCGDGGNVKIVDFQMIGKDELKIPMGWEESPFLINKVSGDLTISGLTMERIEVIDGACVSVTSSGESSELKVSIANSSFKSITSTCGKEGGALSIKLAEENAAFQLKGNDPTSFTSCAAEGCQSKGGGLFLEMTGENSLFQVPKSSSFVVFGKGNRATFGTGMYFVWDNLQTKKEDLTPLGEGLAAAENVIAVCDRGAMEKELDLFVYLKEINNTAKSDIVYAGKSNRAELCFIEEYPCHLISTAMKHFAADDRQKQIIVCGEVEIETDIVWGSTANKEIVISSLPFDEVHSRNVDHSHFVNAQSSRKSQKNNQFERSRMILAANTVVKAQGDAAIKNTQTLTIEHITFLINELKKDLHPSCLISSGGSTAELQSQSIKEMNTSGLYNKAECYLILTGVSVSPDIGTERVTTLDSLLEINSGNLLISGLQVSSLFSFVKSPFLLADILTSVKLSALKFGSVATSFFSSLSSSSVAVSNNNYNYLIVQDGSLIEINRNTINLNGDFSFIESANDPALIKIGKEGHAIISNSHIARCLNGAANEGKGGAFEVCSNGELVLRKTVIESCGMKNEGGCGGAICITGSAELELHSCVIKDCFTGKGGKGCGGGLFIDKDISEFISNETIISGCTTYGGCGGGIYVNVKTEGSLIQAQIKITFEGNGREEEDAPAKGKDAFISDTQATEMTAEANPFYLCGTSEVGRKVYYSNLAIEPAVEKEEEGWLSHDSRKRKVNTNEGTADANCGLSNEQPCKTIKTAIDLFPAQVGAGDDTEKTVELTEENDESEKETILVSKKKVAIEGKLREDRRIASIIITNLEVAGTLFAIDTDGTLNLKNAQITHNSKHEENCQSSLFQVNEGSQRANLILQNIQISTEADYSFNKHFTASLIKSYSGKVRISDISISSFCLEQPAINIVGATSSFFIGGNSTMKHLSQPIADSPAGILINTGDEPIDVAIEGISIVDANAPASKKGGGICVLLNDESSSFHLCHEEAISSEEKVSLSGCRASGETGKGGCIHLSMKQSVDVKFPKYKANILFDSEGDVKSNAAKGKYLFFEAKSLLNCVNSENFGFLVEDYEMYGDWPNLIGCDEAEFANEEIELFKLIFATSENVIKVDAKDGKDVKWCGRKHKCKSFSYGVSHLDFKSANPSLFLLGSSPFSVTEQLVVKGCERNFRICSDSSSDAKANLVFAAEFSLPVNEDDSKESCILFEAGAELENIIISVPEMFETYDLVQPQTILEMRGSSECLKLNKVTFAQRENKTESELQNSYILRKDGSTKTIHSTTDLGSEYRLVLINDGSAEFVEVKLEKPETKDFLLFHSSPFFFFVSSGGHCSLSSCKFSGIKVTTAKEAVVEMKSCEGAKKGATFTIGKCSFSDCVSSKGVEGGALSIKSSLDTSRIRFLDDGPTKFSKCEVTGSGGYGGGLYIYLRSSEEPFGGVEFPKKKENFVIEGNCHAYEGKGIFLDVSDLSVTVMKENFAFAELIDKTQRESLLCGMDGSIFAGKPIDLYSFLLDEYFSDVIFMKGENVDSQHALTSSLASFAFCGHFNAPCKSFGEGTKHFPKDSQRNTLVIEKKAFAEYTYFWTKFDELFISGEMVAFLRKSNLTENECNAIEDDKQYGILDFPSSLTANNDYHAVMSFDYPITFTHLVVSFPPSFTTNTPFEKNANRKESHPFKDNQQAGFVPRGLFFCNGAGTQGKIFFEFCTFQLSSAPTKSLDYYIISSSSGMISLKDVIFDGAQQAAKSVSDSPNINSHANDDENSLLFTQSPIKIKGNGVSELDIFNSLFSKISIAKGPLLFLERMKKVSINDSSLISICRNGVGEMKSKEIGGCIIDIAEQKEEIWISSRTKFSQCTSPLSKKGGVISIVSPKDYKSRVLCICEGTSFEKCACNKDEGRGGAVSVYLTGKQVILLDDMYFACTNEAKIGKNIWVGFDTFDAEILGYGFRGLFKSGRYVGAENEYTISIDKPEALETDLIPVLNQMLSTVRYVSIDGSDELDFCGMKTLPCKTFQRAHKLLTKQRSTFIRLSLLGETVIQTNYSMNLQKITVIESENKYTKQIAELPAFKNTWCTNFSVWNILICRNINFIMGTMEKNENRERITSNEQKSQTYGMSNLLTENAFYAKRQKNADDPCLQFSSCSFTAGAIFSQVNKDLIYIDGGQLIMNEIQFEDNFSIFEATMIEVLDGKVDIEDLTFMNFNFKGEGFLAIGTTCECKFSHCQFSSVSLGYGSLVTIITFFDPFRNTEQEKTIEFDNCKWKNISGNSCLYFYSNDSNIGIELSKCSFTECKSNYSSGVISISAHTTKLISLKKIVMFDCQCVATGSVYISLLKEKYSTNSLISNSSFSLMKSDELCNNPDVIMFEGCTFIGKANDSFCNVYLEDSRYYFIENSVFDAFCYSNNKAKRVYLKVNTVYSHNGWKDEWILYDSLERFVDEKNGADSEGCGIMKTNPCKTIGSAVDKSSNLIQKKIILMGTEFILESTLHVKESIIELFSSDTNKMETKNKARIWGKSNENDFVMFDISSGGKMYFKDLCLVNDADKITGAGISKIISLSKEGEEVWIESCDILGESTKGKVLSTILLHILCGALKMYYVNVRFDGGDTTRPAIVCEERVNYVRWSYGSTTAVSKKGDIEQRGSGIFVDGRKAESSMFIYLSDVIFDSCFTSESDCGGAVTLFITERARLVFLESLKFNNCGSIDRAKGKGGALYVSLEEFSSSDFPVLFYLISFEGCSAAIGKNLAIQNEKGMNGINSDLIKMDFEELYHKENLFVVIDGARKTHDLLTGPDALPYSSRKIYLSSDKGVDQNECGMKEWECKTIEYGIHKLFESGLNECFLILEADAELSAKCTFVNRMTLQPYDAAERKTIKVTKFSDETENEAFAIETTGRMQHLNIKYLREIFSSLTTLIRITGKSFAMEDVCISLFGEAEQPLSVTLLFASNANIQLNNCQFVGMKQETNEDARIGQFVENKNKHFAENTKLKSRNNSHRNEDECSWSDSMVDLHSSNADLNNVTIERSYKYGGLSIINNCSVTISEGTFRENGADAVPYPSFPSIRRNIMCSNNYMQLSTIELDSLKPDSDGMKEGTMLWLSMTNSSNCLAMGNAARSLPSLYFMPSVDSVEAKEVENRLHVAVNGKLLLPCDTFVSYVEHNKKSSEEHYVYDLTQESEDKINFFVDLNNFYAPYITVRFYYSSNNEHHFIEASVPWNNTRKASPEEPTKTFNLTLVVVISVCGSAIGAVIIAASIIYYKKHKKRKSNYQPINDTNASIVQTYIPQSEVPTRQQYQATPSETPESLYY